MMSITARALHFVFKVGDRTSTAKFYREVLGMKILRHEEFKEGCDAACNGPYDNRWSKTMVGYGPEDNHFVVELTYNYTVTSYEQGNDFLGITIKSKEAIERAQKVGWPIETENGTHVVKAPGGYKFYLLDEPQPTNEDPVVKVALASSNLANSLAYWRDVLDMKVVKETENTALLSYGEKQAALELHDIGAAVEHKTAYGRIAFACPHDQQPAIDERIKAKSLKILTPLISLDTPGKATVRVIILADPDEHEICFVDDEGFRQLSQFDPEGEKLLDRYIAKDESRQK